MPDPHIVVIGIGNRWRRDDGVGLAVVEAAAPRLPADVDVVLTDGEPGRLLDRWRSADRVVVVDGARSGAPPGTTTVIHAAELDALPRAGSSHGLGLVEAVRLATALGRAPAALHVVGIEVADVDVGEGLSSAVAAATTTAADAVVELVTAALAPPHNLR